MNSTPPVRVMMVEDSATVRTLLCHIIDRDPRLQLAAVCASAEEALDSIAVVAPDVVSMDIRLPGMDGLEATRQIMALHPTPIVVVADAVHDAGLAIAMNALKAGALSVVEKPVGPAATAYASVADTIATQLFIMSQVPVIRRRMTQAAKPRALKSNNAQVTRPKLLAMAASTGGPPALANVLGALPENFPMPVVVVQHMGAAFMEGFARWLGGQTKLKVKLAEHHESPKSSIVYIAPGDRHLMIDRAGLLSLSNEAPLQSQRPAATLLFRSIAQNIGPAAFGVILTGMGEDGAQGLLEMKQAGAFTVAEDASTAIVNGMPGVAVKIGAAALALPLDAIGPKLVAWVEEASA